MGHGFGNGLSHPIFGVLTGVAFGFGSPWAIFGPSLRSTGSPLGDLWALFSSVQPFAENGFEKWAASDSEGSSDRDAVPY